MTTDITELRKRLRELAEKATPGKQTEICGANDYGPIASRNDAQFIAAANPQTIIALLDSLDRQSSPVEGGDGAMALSNMLNAYVELVKSGECGWWDVDKDPYVLDAREALARLTASFPSPIPVAEINAELLAACQALVADIKDYERVNNLSPSPGKQDCWQSVTVARAAIAKAGGAS